MGNFYSTNTTKTVDPNAVEKVLSFRAVKEKKYGTPSNIELDKILYRIPKLMKQGDQILTSSKNPNRVYAPFSHGLLGTIYQAYSQHVPLVLRPDDIWLSISIAFGNYVTTHSEEMRQYFVEHKGKKELNVRVGPSFDFSSEEEWKNRFLPKMTELIRENTPENLVEWLAPNFTTTTELDRAIAGIVLMGTVKEYFAFSMTMGCGISKLTLKGTRQDWRDLIEKVKQLKHFEREELDCWSDILVDILQNFVDAYDDKIDADFWQRICTQEGRGSGEQSDFRGWFLAFYPFDKNGKYILNSPEEIAQTKCYGFVADDDIVDCKISAPVKINSDGQENTEKLVTLVAGTLSSTYEPETNTLSPSWEWASISNKFLELTDLEEHLEAIIKNNPTRLKDDALSQCRMILPFSHYLADELHVPNDELMGMVQEVCQFVVSNKEEYVTFGEKLRGFVDFLQRPVFLLPNPFEKYLVEERIPGIISSYLGKE